MKHRFHKRHMHDDWPPKRPGRDWNQILFWIFFGTAFLFSIWMMIRLLNNDNVDIIWILH